MLSGAISKILSVHSHLGPISRTNFKSDPRDISGYSLRRTSPCIITHANFGLLLDLGLWLGRMSNPIMNTLSSPMGSALDWASVVLAIRIDIGIEAH